MAKKRITLTLPTDMLEDIKFIADFTGTTKSQVISILIAYIDLEEIKKWKKEKAEKRD